MGTRLLDQIFYMKIRKLHIEKYRVFEEVTFDFIDKNGKTLDTIVLAGVNGCGKTTVLELIKDILKYNELVRSAIGNLYVEIEISNQQKVNMMGNVITLTSFDNPLKKYIENLPEIQPERFLMKLRENVFSQQNPIALFRENLGLYFTSYNTEGVIDGRVLLRNIDNSIKNLEETLLKSVRDEVFKNKHISPQQTIENAVQKVNFLLSDFKLNTKLIDFESERMVFESLNGEKIYFDDLSNGEKQLYFRAISLYQLNINEGIILVDEPEDSLHPTWQKAILSLYQKIGTNNQVIVATHSPHIMASVKPESLFLLHVDEQEKGRKVQVLNMAKEGKHSKGLEPNRILKEIMEVEILRDFETQQAIDKLTKLLNIQDFEKEETINLIAQLTTDLGKQDPFILKVNHQILMLNRQKEKLNHATH